MLKTLLTRFEQGNKTSTYPRKDIHLVEDYRGAPEINGNCPEEIVNLCVENCPQNALNARTREIDLGKCVFCGTCQSIVKGQFVRFTNKFELGATIRQQLIIKNRLDDLAIVSKKHIRKLFGRTLQLRQVSAGGCNACEADVNVLGTPFFDMARFGIQFVASPRHADGMFVTGPVTQNMKTALLKTYEAIPEPKIVIASGACAISGGPFYGSPDIVEWINRLIPVDLFIPGCPPHPMTTLHALLKFLGRV